MNSEGDFPENLSRCFGAKSQCGRFKAVQGIIVNCWTVHHAKRRTDPEFQNDEHPGLTDRDRTLCRFFSYKSYVSPSCKAPDGAPEAPCLPRGQRTAQ